GAELLTALAVGFEAATRIGRAIEYATQARPRGWHMPGIIGPFGGAAAAGRLRKLDPMRMRNAFALAGAQSAGTWGNWKTPSVKFHQSRGAGGGYIAAHLAEQDWVGSPEILTHPDGGILNAYSGGGSPELLAADLGQH